MDAGDFARELIRSIIQQVKETKLFPTFSMEVPSTEAVKSDPPWVVFDAFLEELRRVTQRNNILVCFDEMQDLVRKISDTDNPMDDGFLRWMRSKIQERSDTFLVCTGSESYAVMQGYYKEAKLWGNMDPYNVSFVDRDAMDKIVTMPVATDGVIWLPEALERMWSMTEGHPWLTQLHAEKVAIRLNFEHRRLVGPADVDRAAEELIVTDSRSYDLWWNEKTGQVTATHRQIAFLILQNQAGGRQGLPESQLAEICQRSGIRTIGKHLDEMHELEVISEFRKDDEQWWRIRGGFLELYLMRLMQRILREQESGRSENDTGQPMAVMLDWENIKIGLHKYLETKPEAEAEKLRQRLEPERLGKRLIELAKRHGIPRQRWAVANWDGPFFAGDQKALKLGGLFWFDMSGVDKQDASDSVLIQKISYILREHPEINTYIIGTGDADFAAQIGTLLEQGKHVVLWCTEKTMSKNAYTQFLTGPDQIQIEWLEELIFAGEEIEQ
jgi:hypothetical protein